MPMIRTRFKLLNSPSHFRTSMTHRVAISICEKKIEETMEVVNVWVNSLKYRQPFLCRIGQHSITIVSPHPPFPLSLFFHFGFNNGRLFPRKMNEISSCLKCLCSFPSIVVISVTRCISVKL